MGILAGFISYPFDTVRRRLQMQAEKPKERWLYNGTLDCAVKIVKDEGVGAMFKGFAANAGWRARARWLRRDQAHDRPVNSSNTLLSAHPPCYTQEHQPATGDVAVAAAAAV